MTKTPWHIWVVGGLTFLWNLGGVVDYVMTKFKVEAYLSQLTPQQMDFFQSFPAWVVAAWAIAVWCALGASLLILLRHRWAVPVMWASFVGMIITSFHNFVLSDVSISEIMGPGAMIFSAAIVVITLLLLWYVTAQRNAGRLR